MAIEIVTVELGCFVLHDHVANMIKRVTCILRCMKITKLLANKLKYLVDGNEYLAVGSGSEPRPSNLLFYVLDG